MTLQTMVTRMDDASYEDRLRELCQQLNAEGAFRAHPVPKDEVATVIQRLASVGALDLGFLTEEGFRPGDVTRVATTSRILAANSGAISTSYAVNVIFGGLFVALMGTPEQHTLLRLISRGKCQLAFALTEPQSGSDAASIQTTATPKGGGYVLDGEKIFTTGAQNADYILVAGRIADRGASPRALTIFLVPNGLEGLSIEPLGKLAGNELASCRVSLNGVEVPENAVLGGSRGLGDAWRYMRLTGAMERLTIAAEATGLAGAIVDRAITFARQRKQFGQPVASFQAIQHKLVDMKTTQISMRLMVDRAAQAMEERDDATEEVCMAKYYCAEKLQEVVAAGMRVLGGRAYFEFEEMARYYREAPLSLYAGGTIEIQKNLIARAMKL